MKNLKYIIMFGVLLITFFFVVNHTSSGFITGRQVQSPTQSLEVKVDAGKTIGEMPEVFRAGMWFLGKDMKYIFDKFISENVPGVSQFTLNPIAWSECNQSHSKAIPNEDLSECVLNYKKLLIQWFKPGSLLRHEFDTLKNNDAHISVNLLPGWFMPRWLSQYNYRPISDPICNGQKPIECSSVECQKICGADKCCDAHPIVFTELYGNVVGGNTLPREDGWDEWREMIEFTAKFYQEETFFDNELGEVEGLGIKDISFEFGHEPDWCFFGSEDELFKFYGETMATIKKPYPNVKIGGIGASWFHRIKTCPYPETLKGFCRGPYAWHDTKDNELILKNFLEYTDEKGQQLPIDFLNYHQWGVTRFGNYFQSIMEDTKKWLSATKRSNIIHYPGDWNLDGHPIEDNPEHDLLDTEFQSAYTVSTLYDMEKAGIDWHAHDFDVFEDAGAEKTSKERNGSIFVGSWSIFTEIYESSIILPVYNSFRALSILNGKKEGQTPNRLQVNFNENGFITAIASRTKDVKTNRVLLSNFIPSGDMIGLILLQTLKSCMLSKGYTEDQLKANWDALQQTAKANPPKNGMTFEYIKKIISLTDFPGNNDEQIRKDLYSCLESSVIPQAKEIQYYQKNPREVKIVLSSLKPGAYTVNQYTIDKDHSNSCRYNKKTESTSTNTECGINGEIDRRVKTAKEESQAKGKEAAFAYLKSKGYTDRDIGLIVEMVKRCEMKVQCMIETVDQHYLKLDRCQNNKCSSSEIVKSEIKEAITIFRDVKDKLFYGEIDKINNDPSVSLEGSKQTRTITVKDDGSYTGTITMQPYSVILLEISSAILPPTYTLTVSKSGSGTGTITSEPVGIDCGSDCSEAYNSGTSVILTATPNHGSVFAGWSGLCSGTGSCTFTMDGDKGVTAVFNLKSSSVSIGPAELLYTDAQMPFTMDGSFATLKKDLNEMYFFHTYATMTYKYSGPLNSPLQTKIWEKSNTQLWNMQGYSGSPWIVNIYKRDNGDLLGFIHTEIGVQSPPIKFRIGLGYSTTNGDSWTYCGEIIKPQDDSGNIGGVPYLVIGDYFYVYYNEWLTGGNKRLSVARAKVTDVLEAASRGSVTPWKKYNNGVWDQDGLTGVGSNIIPETSGDWRYDFHSDAAYSSALNKYLLLVQTHNLGQLLLYMSNDGVNWGNRNLVDETPDNNYSQAYSSFAALSDATDDCHEVGSEFYIIFPRKDWPDHYDYDELYRRKITIPVCGNGICEAGENELTCPEDCTPEKQYSLTITQSSTAYGSGTVTSSPSGIDCGSDCTEPYASGTSVTLTATPNTGSVFAGWSGDADCSDGVVIMDASKTCIATFNPYVAFTYRVNPVSASKQVGQTQQFIGWYDPDGPSGPKTEQDVTSSASWNSPNSNIVTVTSSGLATCKAAGSVHITSVYNGITAKPYLSCVALPTYTLSVSKSATGSGTGTITSNPAGINCGSDCSEAYTSGTSVTLTASAATGSFFAGWSGDCSDTSSCILSMVQNRNVIATFNINTVPKGWLDIVDCNAFYGWACDPDYYAEPLHVHFYDGPAGTGQFIGWVNANQPREAAVGGACGGNQNHGFVFATPSSLKDGLSHSIYAYAINIPSGTNPELLGSPKTLTCQI